MERPGISSASKRSVTHPVPVPLALLLIVVCVCGAAWAMLMPPWQSPDSFTHFTYAESIATRHQLPGRPGFAELSSNAAAADLIAGGHRVQWSAPEAKPDWNAQQVRRRRAAAASLSRADGAGATPSENYPPVYYGYAAGAYLLDVGGSDLGRLNVMQLAGVLLMLATTTGVWLLAGEVFGRQRLLQLVAAAVAGLEPMNVFMSTSINPDALLITLWTFVLWSGVRVTRSQNLRRDALILCLLTAAAALTKATSYALVPPVVIALVVGWWRQDRATRGPILGQLGIPVLALAAPILVWLAALHSGGRQTLTAAPPTGAVAHAPGAFVSSFLDYLWQFYLPRLPGQAPFPVPRLGSLPWPRLDSGLPVWNIWIKQGWGVFGWLDVVMPGWVYTLLGALTGVVALGCLKILLTIRGAHRLLAGGFLALCTLALLAVVHVIEFDSLRSGGGAFAQGRYLLPLIGILGLCFALPVSRLPIRLRGFAAGTVFIGLLALQLLALGTVARTYYT